jgi:SAM-dependent methyltransferase
MRGTRRAGPVAGRGCPPHPADTPVPTPPARDASVIWHEVECGGYSADLRLWEELAAEHGGPILELGCGSGRVSSQLIRRGLAVRGLDSDSKLIEALADAELADARDFELGRQFALVLGPMQLIQLFAGSAERESCLGCVAEHLTPGGLAAFAIVEQMPEPVDAAPPLPDTREVDGWVYSSLPIEARVEAGTIRVRRLRQTVSPAGELHEDVDEVLLQALDASALEAEAEEAGLRRAGRRAIPPTADHVGSTVVLLERGP